MAGDKVNRFPFGYVSKHAKEHIYYMVLNYGHGRLEIMLDDDMFTSAITVVYPIPLHLGYML